MGNQSQPCFLILMKTTLENKFVKKLIVDLTNEGIMFSLDQEEIDIIGFEGDIIGRRKLENVVFTKNDQIHKIYNGIFFREGGLSQILQMVKVEKKIELFKPVVVTDDIFYESMKLSILNKFNKIYE